MLKNAKFALKMAAGFALLLLIMALALGIGVAALRSVSTKAAGVAAAKDVSTLILAARRDEKNFIIRGDQKYADNVVVTIGKLNAVVERLSAAVLTRAQKDEASGVRSATDAYAKAFASYKDSKEEAAAREVQWKETGNRLTEQLTRSSSRQGLDFLAVRLAAVNWLEMRSDTQWEAFSESARSFASTPLGAAAEALEQYMKEAEDTRAMFQQEEQLDAQMVNAARAVIDGAARIDTQLTRLLEQASASALLFMILSGRAHWPWERP